MRHLRERLLLLAILVGLPLGFGLGVLRPALRRVAELKQRINAASEELKSLPGFRGVGEAERAVLRDPDRAWRRRMPVVAGEQARLAHYHRVVSEAQQVWRASGTPSLGLRSSWDPIRASFTLEGGLEAGLEKEGEAVDAPEFQVRGWVLEARFGGPPDALFKALRAVPQVGPLLEPVGLRWSSADGERRQVLLLRNLVVQP